MAAQGGGEEGRKERTKSLPPPPDRTAQRRWKNLTDEGGGDNQRKNFFSQEREESFLSERERERDLVRAFRLEAPTTILLTKLVAVKSTSALGTSMSWRITSFASI
jgi:hypothetical protein